MEAVLRNASVFEILLKAEDDSKLGKGGQTSGGVPIDYAQLGKKLTEKLGVDITGLSCIQEAKKGTKEHRHS